MVILAARFDKYAHSKKVIKPGKGIIKELVLGVENACRMLIDHGLVGPGNHSAMIPAEQVRRKIACATPLRARNGEQCMSRLEFGTWLGLLCDLFDFPTLLGIHIVEKIKERSSKQIGARRRKRRERECRSISRSQRRSTQCHTPVANTTGNHRECGERGKSCKRWGRRAAASEHHSAA